MPERSQVPRAVTIGVLVFALVEATILLAGMWAVQGQKHRGALPANRAASAERIPFDPPQLPVIPGARHRGVCFVAAHEPVGPAVFDDLRAHGVTWISQTPFGWQARVDEPTFRIITDGHVYWGERDSGLAETARLARARGIRTLLKPHLWLRDRANGQWEGKIAMTNEADWQRWFARYEEFIVHYAELAEALGLEGLCVGAELEGTSARTEDWRRVIAAVRRVYHGRLTYAANWSGEFERIEFWDDLDWIGIQAYFPLSSQAEASVDELVAGWAPHVARIEAVQKRFARPVLFTEIGYKAAARATVEPWTWTTTDRYDEGEQARAYEAAFRVLWGKPWCAGMYWWKWFPDGHREAGGRDFYFTPQDKPAAEVLSKWYR
jgi:glycosyl hydrolase family 113